MRSKIILRICFLCQFIFQLTESSGHCDFDVDGIVSKEFALENHQIWSSKTINIVECAKTCVKRKLCRSFNFDTVSRRCELNNDTYESSKVVRWDPRLLYSDIKHWPAQLEPECFERPCADDEVCMPGFLAGNQDCSYSCLKSSQPSTSHSPTPTTEELTTTAIRQTPSTTSEPVIETTTDTATTTTEDYVQTTITTQEPTSTQLEATTTTTSAESTTTSTTTEEPTTTSITFEEQTTTTEETTTIPTTTEEQTTTPTTEEQTTTSTTEEQTTTSTTTEEQTTTSTTEEQTTTATTSQEQTTTPTTTEEQTTTSTTTEEQTTTSTATQEQTTTSTTEEQTTTSTTTQEQTTSTASTVNAVKLEGGAATNEGSLEMRYTTYPTSWRSVHLDTAVWNWKATKVVCKQLGFNFGGSYHRAGHPFSQTIYKTYKLVGLDCTGRETSIFDCHMNQFEAADFGEGIGITCFTYNVTANTSVRLVQGADDLHSYVEVHYLNNWTRVCRDLINKAPDVFCKVINGGIVKWPTVDQWRLPKGNWEKIPSAIGAIDGTSQKVNKPSTEPQEQFYSGHRNCHVIHTQIVIDSNGTIVHVESGLLGHMNDAQQYRPMSNIGPNEQLNIPQECNILADKIYANRSFGREDIASTAMWTKNIECFQDTVPHPFFCLNEGWRLENCTHRSTLVCRSSSLI